MAPHQAVVTDIRARPGPALSDTPPHTYRVPFKLDPNVRSAVVIVPASRIGGCVLGVFFGIVPLAVGLAGLAGLVFGNGFHPGLLAIGLVFPALGGVALWGVFAHLLTTRRYELGTVEVTVRARHVAGARIWQLPYERFRGVQLRLERVGGGRYGGGYPVARVELSHVDWRLSVPLMVGRPQHHYSWTELRSATRAFADCLGVPVVQPQRWIERWSPVRRFTAAPWPESWDAGLRPQALGRGSSHTFEWYFTRDSTVAVAGVQDIVDWLVECRYVDDKTQFGVDDVWQHPCAFEDRRVGDCEDHALWAWRKLIELGFEARLFSGLVGAENGTVERHVWVNYLANGIESIFEATSKDRNNLVRPFALHSRDYYPYFSVGRDFKIRSHRGNLLRHLGFKWHRGETT